MENFSPVKIRDRVGVRAHPTVVRLDDLDAGNAAWVTHSFVLTADLQNHLKALRDSLQRESGAGVFLIGHYGSGKSHFLAYLVEELRANRFVARPLRVAFLSLVNYRSEQRLEDIVARLLGIASLSGDRREAWKTLLERDESRQGLVLVLDELSEFLRSKDNDRSFTEDIRFLQFLGEWAQNHPLWIIAAIQEAIEHTGEIEYSLYRKIKDRYPLRLLLTPSHVHTLIAEGILEKKPGYEQDVAKLLDTIRASFPGIELDQRLFCEVYPLHPATIELLDEVRDRFSQARGIVDFTVKRLAGDEQRSIPAFLDQPWGSFLGPDAIVDHFSDLFELQPEFMPLAQQVLPWYRKNLAKIFENPALQALAERALNLLILIHLSPAREELSAEQAAEWLFHSAIQSDPSKNRAIVQKVLAKLAAQGRYVSGGPNAFRLNLKDDGRVQFEHLLEREIERLPRDEPLILDSLLSLLSEESFNPFVLPRNRWQHRRLFWHFHEREYTVWFGEEQPDAKPGISFCVRLPWGEQKTAAGMYSIEPEKIRVTSRLRELAALLRMRQQALSPEIKKIVEDRLLKDRAAFVDPLRNAFGEAMLVTPDGKRERAPRLERGMNLERWLESLGLLILRRTYPAFERFAPSHGPLPREAWSRLMRFALSDDLGKADADDHVRLIREAYLLPMGLLRRKGRDYVAPANLEQQELVKLVLPMCRHSPSPKTIHQRLSEPIYGLVPDQINLLLVFLVIQGEIELFKEQRSYREAFETLENPLHYDRIEIGHALSVVQLGALTRLSEALHLKLPQQWTLLAQKRAIEQIRETARKQHEEFQPLLQRLQSDRTQVPKLLERLLEHLQVWDGLRKIAEALKGFQAFLEKQPSLEAFIHQIQQFQVLKERLPGLIEEMHRFRHLFSNPALQERAREACVSNILHVEEVRDYEDLQELEDWLKRARTVYDKYKAAYAQAHEQWWEQHASHAALHWQAPLVAHSRHIGLGDDVKRVHELQQRALKRSCRGLVNLDYQPLCACGFDGESAPFATLVDECEKLERETEAKLESFFRQDHVKEAIGSWQASSLPQHGDVADYLSGSRVIPRIEDLAWFDRNLSQESNLVDADPQAILKLLEETVWEPKALQKTLTEHLLRYAGKRVRFVSSQPRADTNADLLQWCVEQSLKFGVPLPECLTTKDHKRIETCLRPEWVGDPAILRIDGLGLNSAAVDKILGWLIKGQIRLPELAADSGGVFLALREILTPEAITDPRDLARRSEALYRQHARFVALAEKRWLDRLDEVANTLIEPKPMPLIDALQRNSEALWLMIDCWGLPLFRPLLKVIVVELRAWKYERTDFALVEEPSTTDNFHRQLMNANISHAFEKCTVIDQILHERNVEFDEFVRIAETEAAIALKRIAAKLDPAQALLIFADHGFRFDPSGRKLKHGGPSTLERIVPVCRFSSREKGG